MAPHEQRSKKRPANRADRDNARPSKKSKTIGARSILSQTSERALSANGELDINAFVKAREFEIRALEDNMASSKKAGSSRAFQSVPPNLRRRTASHNVKRVPKRLRARAAKEMRDDNTPTVEKNKREKSTKQHIRAQNAKLVPELAKRIERQKEKEARKLEKSPIEKQNQLVEPKPTVVKHKKRQINKSWLPTHVWHAKRARMTPPMEPLWRFAIPLTPNEKTARVTGRASRLRGCVAWDTSYTSTFSLEGSEASLLSMFRTFSISEKLLTGKLGVSWRSGARSCAAWVCESTDSKRPIARSVFIWDAKETTEGNRRVFVRTQPSAFLQLWEQCLEIGKAQTPGIRVEDLRFAIGSIEIIGPASLEAVVGVLHPTEDGSGTPEAVIWPKLAAIQDSFSVPKGAMLSLLVADPRLSQPHQTVLRLNFEPNEELTEFCTTWSLPGESPVIFSLERRHKASRSLQTQSAVNKRKGAALPGNKPEPLPNDPKIPILLLANNLEKKGQKPGSWTVLMPWDCVLPTWHSLMHYPLSTGSNPRFGGLQEQRQLSLEDNRPWFPGDFPGTKSGWTWELDQRKKRKEEWDRKPKSRRVAWSTLDLGTGMKGELGLGWACDWQFIFHNRLEDELSAAKTEDMTDQTTDLIHLMNPTLDTPNSFPPKGLTTVSITLAGKGMITACARVYRLPAEDTELRATWMSQLQKKSLSRSRVEDSSPIEAILETPLPAGNSTAEKERQSPDHPAVPPASDLVGFVTSGNFNLAKGCSTGVGSIVWARMVNDARRSKAGALYGYCVVREAGQSLGRLATWECIS